MNVVKLKENKACNWIREYDYIGDYYDTSCDSKMCFTDSGIKENDYLYCPFCGNEIKELSKEKDNEHD